MTNEILILGAGRVAGPAVRALLVLPETTVTVATELVEQAEALLGSTEVGRAVPLRVEDRERLASLVRAADVVLSLVPPALHPEVAEACIAHRVPLVTTSYVSEEIWGLDRRARDAGALILMECGEDPGLDHMGVKQTIDEVHGRGGEVVSLCTYGAGLADRGPSLNPLGHRLAWSPKGLLQAATRDAVTLAGRELSRTPGGAELFRTPGRIEIPSVGWMETYPNRDVRPYVHLLGVPEVRDLYRGLLRFPGWCATMAAFASLGFLDESPASFTGKSYADLVDQEPLRHLPSDVVDRLDWLGLLADDPVPLHCQTRLDALAVLMEKRLAFAPGERDLVIVHGELEARVHGQTELHTATLIARGDPHPGETAMSRAVGWTAAEAVRLVLENELSLTGVHIPVHPEIYRPLLAALERRGLAFARTRSTPRRS